MKTLIIIIILLTSSVTNAQNFIQSVPTDFTEVSFEIDPLGSIDKQGLNAVITLTNVDFDIVEESIQFQTIFNDEGEGFGLTYLSIQAGVAILIPIKYWLSISPGIHGGLMMRPNYIVANTDSKDYTGDAIYGLTFRSRIYINRSHRTALIFSSSYDHRWDNQNWELNNSLGISHNW
tara:strand:- start:6474 stop:7004 length:531 start_codon:yes stop_codon:yes gene_type:complete